VAQIVISVKTLLALLFIIFVLLHVALYYSTGFNLTMETIKFLKELLGWMIEKLVG